MVDIYEIARPYVESAKPGDVLRVGECSNPPGWWTVYRNDRPIHHFPDREVADAVCKEIADVQFKGE